MHEIGEFSGQRLYKTGRIAIRDGRDRAGLWVNEQDKRHQVFSMLDHRGQLRYWTSIESGGKVHTVFKDTRGRARIEMGVDENDRVFLRILDRQENVIRDLAR